MKTQRAHRRKLRFSSTKVAAPVAATKAERVPKQPVKRRTRQQRSRRVSPVSSSHNTAAQDLPSATWSDVQERLAAAKNLGELAEEEEDLRCAECPGSVESTSANAAAGIGVIKRVRCVETRKTKGGFLYFGKGAVIQRLAEMQSNAAQVMVTFRQRRGLKPASITEQDSALVQAIEEQATAEKWTGLTSTTVCFLSLLFQQDFQVGMAVPGLSERLVEAKKSVGALVSTSPQNEPPYTDVQRRVYGAVSVLVACNLILTAATTATSVGASRELSDKSSQRKYVRFNYDIFADPRLLFSTSDSEAQWDDTANQEAWLGATESSFCAHQSPAPTILEKRLVSPPSACWQSIHAEIDMTTLPGVACFTHGGNRRLKNRSPGSSAKNRHVQEFSRLSDGSCRRRTSVHPSLPGPRAHGGGLLRHRRRGCVAAAGGGAHPAVHGPPHGPVRRPDHPGLHQEIAWPLGDPRAVNSQDKQVPPVPYNTQEQKLSCGN
ncbi:hypothetical protein ON010_g8261 [Phytophthora cinnamomi]|nr:hypothetical protein ON010_g8261 [Phytophthora cinnamomi]